MKREIAETLVGTHNHVKVIYHLLDETIDPSFGRGVSLFNKACKTLEQTVQLERIDFESAYKATQVPLRNYSAQRYADSIAGEDSGFIRRTQIRISSSRQIVGRAQKIH